MAESACASAGTRAEARAERRGADKRRDLSALLSAVTSGLSVTRYAALMRGRFEEGLRALVQARSIVLRDAPSTPAPPTAVCFDVPGPPPHHRARLEAVLEPKRLLDGWTCQLLESAAQRHPDDVWINYHWPRSWQDSRRGARSADAPGKRDLRSAGQVR